MTTTINIDEEIQKRILLEFLKLIGIKTTLAKDIAYHAQKIKVE